MKHLTVCMLLISCGQPFEKQLFIDKHEMDSGYDKQLVNDSAIHDSNIIDYDSGSETSIVTIRCCGLESREVPCTEENAECSFTYDIQTYVCKNGHWIRTETHWKC